MWYQPCYVSRILACAVTARVHARRARRLTCTQLGNVHKHLRGRVPAVSCNEHGSAACGVQSARPAVLKMHVPRSLVKCARVYTRVALCVAVGQSSDRPSFSRNVTKRFNYLFYFALKE